MAESKIINSNNYVDGTSNIVFESTGIPSSLRSNVFLYKVGRTATLKIAAVKNDAGPWTVVFTLPSDFAPISSIYAIGMGGSGNPCGIFIGADRKVSFYLHNHTDSYDAQIVFETKN